MATVQPTITPVYGQTNLDGYLVVWAGLAAAGDVGAAVGSTIGSGANAILAPGGGFLTGFGDKSVQVTGSFGSACSVAMEGNNDGSGSFWFDLSDPQGNPIAITAASLKQLEEVVVQIRPHVTAGSGGNLTVAMFARKTQNP